MAPGGLIVRNARLHPTTASDSALRDVLVDGDAIAAIRPAGAVPADGRHELDAEGRLLSPPLVDPHVHMDAVLTVGEPRHNESGTLIEGILTWAERKPFLTHEDVKARALEAIRWEVAQGTGPDPLARRRLRPEPRRAPGPDRAARGGPRHRRPPADRLPAGRRSSRSRTARS